jgi:putative transposase
MIDPLIEARLHAQMAVIARDLGCPILASGGTNDHVHVLVRMIPAVSIAEWVRDVKAGSSLHVRSALRRREFRWQSGYGVFSLGLRSLPTVRAYILNQKTHHATGDLLTALERDAVEVRCP